MIEVKLDEDGVLLADVEVEEWVRHKLGCSSNIHIANEFTLLCIRATLCKMPIAERPDIRWIIYGKECFFDGYLRSYDAFLDPRMTYSDNWLMTVAFPQIEF